ncbi:MAG: S-adenosylmethionine:tRNA ribosyltransferase-isomerase [Bacteroidia bacterium]|nr:S-adenosylmethionine:tRNA ribosyltransferase-isomerase [Bacteroidia bacterium]
MLWSYELPPDRIAQYPSPERHDARLLIYRAGQILETTFLHLDEFLPAQTRLFYNDSRVISARLKRGKHEVLLTEIVEGTWYSGSPQIWKGLYRPGRFWRRGSEVIWTTPSLTLHLRWRGKVDDRQGYFLATWTPPDLSALSVVEAVGLPPLPPYLHREPDPTDRERYQTVYAESPGSVAAPTAGLHFTPAVWERLKAKGITLHPLTLHVGVGTFLPLKTPETPEKHPMHAERFIVRRDSLEALRHGEGPIVCTGTTTLRLVESLYWLGVLYARGQRPQALSPLIWQEETPTLSPQEALSALPDTLEGMTSLYILPGYPFQLCEGLITNFHLPGSTLLGLVQAFIGRDGIEAVYTYALNHGFRFLSYGDTSLLWRT